MKQGSVDERARDAVALHLRIVPIVVRYRPHPRRNRESQGKARHHWARPELVGGKNVLHSLAGEAPSFVKADLMGQGRSYRR